MAAKSQHESRDDTKQSLTRQPSGLMSLPAEVRHTIYEHLFCHQGSPIWLGTRYMGLRGMEPSEPTFYTALFRVRKDIYLDAVSFAYSTNDFVLRDCFPAFCKLGLAALGALRDLTVVHNSWTAAHAMEDSAWNVIKTKCVGLKCLELDLHSDVLLEAVPYLEDFFGSINPNGPRPRLVLDLYVWERHFSFFETSDRDYMRSLNLLRGVHEKSPSTPRFIHPKARVMRLPPSARDIVLSADVNASAIQALDTFLESNSQVLLKKYFQSLPKIGRRALGRSARYCYVWSDPVAPAKDISNMLEGTSREHIVLS